MRTFAFFKWNTQVICSSNRTKGEEHSNLQSPSFSGISIPLLTSSWTCFSHHMQNPNAKNEVLHMLGVLVSTVVSHLVTRNEWPTNRPNEIRVRSWHCQALEIYCILTTNYLISQTWGGRFISILLSWWTSDSFMALRIEMNLHSKW